jgi:hypothetical protein
MVFLPPANCLPVGSWSQKCDRESDKTTKIYKEKFQKDIFSALGGK